jgi:hypothetical protein
MSNTSPESFERAMAMIAEGMSRREAARLLGCSESPLRGKLKRVRSPSERTTSARTADRPPAPTKLCSPATSG